MNSNPIDPSKKNENVFIHMLPGKRMRFGMMMSTLIPGLILILSVVSSINKNEGILWLKIFSALAGVLVIFASVREFKKPGSSKFMGADTTTVFTGFLILAQGSNMFNALKGFQPAHGYFLAGFFVIFKGVMVPEKKLQRGFIVTEDEIKFRASFVRLKRIPIADLKSIDFANGIINFEYSNSETLHVPVKRAANGPEMAASLNDLVFK